VRTTIECTIWYDHILVRDTVLYCNEKVYRYLFSLPVARCGQDNRYNALPTYSVQQKLNRRKCF
jgi:hypothetical protein